MSSAKIPSELGKSAISARSFAYAPYSGFSVGAAVLLADGSTITAANLENASYGLSLCAEAIAIGMANAQGKLAEIRAIAVAGGPKGAAPVAITPCGRCRQMLAEVRSVSRHPIAIYCATGDGTAWRQFTIDELLPDAFTPGNLATPKSSES